MIRQGSGCAVGRVAADKMSAGWGGPELVSDVGGFGPELSGAPSTSSPPPAEAECRTGRPCRAELLAELHDGERLLAQYRHVPIEDVDHVDGVLYLESSRKLARHSNWIFSSY